MKIKLSEILIKTKELTKKYTVGNKDIYALKNVSLDIVSGNLTILCGRSGAGKTTLLNQLCLLDRPSDGELFFDDKNVTNIDNCHRDDIRRKEFGIVFQSLALMPYMTAEENIDFGMRIAGIDTSERLERVKECLSKVGLSKRASHMPAELSGGEQQRVAIARAIAHKPRVLFADEPTAELDTKTGVNIVNVFLDLITNEEITVVMTTHDPALIELGNRIYTLSDGEVTDEKRS